MRILLTPLGSEGDVNPFIWLAAGLRDRGHEVCLLLSPHYGWLADEQKIPWVPVGEEEDFLKFARHPQIWDPQKGTAFVLRSAAALLGKAREAYERASGPFDLVITSAMGMAISYLAESQGIPHLMIHLQPICMRSVYETPVYLSGTAWMNRMPHFVKHGFFALVDVMLNHFMRREVNAYRRTLGLKPVKNVYREALMAADQMALLFPDWFAAPQPDWPTNLRQFSFPLRPSAQPAPLSPDLEAFLAAGAPPVVWSHGSANFDVKDFQAIALAASKELGTRCLLVSLEPPAQSLPDWAFHINHVKFDALFPRCRAVVNHGGIGTLSKALAAGVPQLVVPMAHDQPDNGHRIEKLGVGASIPYSKFTAARAVAQLSRLVESPEVAQKCRAIQHQIARAAPLPELCEWIETFPACRKSL